MGYIKFNNQITNFELDNMLFIKVYDMYDFYGKLLTNQIELCDHTTILNEKNYIITPSTRIKDIFSLAKTNIFGKKILEFSQNEQIDSEQLNDFSANTQIKKFLNNYFDYEDNFDIDINKLISLCFEWDNDKLIGKKEFLALLKLLNHNEYGSKILLFNNNWIDQDVINAINHTQVKVIYVFNIPIESMIPHINNNLEKLIIQNDHSFLLYDHIKNNNDDWKTTSDIKFIKI